MKTDYKVTIEHSASKNPDAYVNAAELVINRALQIRMENRTGFEWLLEMTSCLGDVANAQRAIENKLTGSNPSEIEKSEIFAYIKSLKELCAVTLSTLTALTYERKRDELFKTDNG